jgi:hypothetical protein
MRDAIPFVITRAYRARQGNGRAAIPVGHASQEAGYCRRRMDWRGLSRGHDRAAALRHREITTIAPYNARGQRGSRDSEDSAISGVTYGAGRTGHHAATGPRGPGTGGHRPPEASRRAPTILPTARPRAHGHPRGAATRPTRTPGFRLIETATRKVPAAMTGTWQGRRASRLPKR